MPYQNIHTYNSGCNACIEYPDVRVTRYIAGFTAGLFGTTYKQAAEATQKLKNTGKIATDTAKKVNLSLAGIDEMNILSDNSEIGRAHV